MKIIEYNLGVVYIFLLFAQGAMAHTKNLRHFRFDVRSLAAGAALEEDADGSIFVAPVVPKVLKLVHSNTSKVSHILLGEIENMLEVSFGQSDDRGMQDR